MTKRILIAMPVGLYKQILRRENAAAAKAIRRASVTGWIIQAIRDALERPDNEEGR
jgi:uncharacterized membrane protein